MNFLVHPLANSIVALIFGILILIFPRILNYAVALYLLFVGIMGLVTHFG